MADGEPLWLPQDTAYALAWQSELDVQCPGCGEPLDESMSPEQERNYKANALRCHACAEKGAAAAAFDEQGSGDRAGLYFSVQQIDH